MTDDALVDSPATLLSCGSIDGRVVIDDSLGESTKPQELKLQVADGKGARTKIKGWFSRLKSLDYSVFSLCKKMHPKEATNPKQDAAGLKQRTVSRMNRRKPETYQSGVLKKWFNLVTRRIDPSKVPPAWACTSGVQHPLSASLLEKFAPDSFVEKPPKQQYLDDPRGWTMEEPEQYGSGYGHLDFRDTSSYYDSKYNKTKREGKKPAHKMEETKNEKLDEHKTRKRRTRKHRSKKLTSDEVSKRSSFANDFYRHTVTTTAQHVDLEYEGCSWR